MKPQLVPLAIFHLGCMTGALQTPFQEAHPSQGLPGGGNRLAGPLAHMVPASVAVDGSLKGSDMSLQGQAWGSRLRLGVMVSLGPHEVSVGQSQMIS